MSDQKVDQPVGITQSLFGCVGVWWADGTWACSCGEQDWEGDPEYAETYAVWAKENS